MPGVRRGLVPPLLTTTQTQSPANTFNPMNTDGNAVIGQIPLQTLRTIALACPVMSSAYLQCQSFFFPLSDGKRTLDPGIITALRHFQHAAQQQNGINQSHLFDYRVPCSDSLAKYAAAFFKMSLSIFANTSSRFTLASSCSSSVKGR